MVGEAGIILPHATANPFIYYRTITIDHTKCGTATNTGFSQLLYFSDATLKTIANGGKVQNSSGYDIVITSDIAGTIPMNYTLIYYDGVNGIWYGIVKVDISNSIDKVVYLQYDNILISTSQSAGSGFDANYKGVWVWQDGTTLHTNDLTSNAYNLTNTSGTATSVGIDGGINFTGNPAHNELSTASGLLINYPLKVTSLVNWTGSTELYNTIVEANQSGGGNYIYTQMIRNTGKLSTYIYNNNSPQVSVDGFGSGTISTGTPTEISFTWDGATLTNYINGSPDMFGATSATGVSYTPTQGTFYISKSQFGSGRYVNGKLGWVSIESSVRNLSWETAVYNMLVNNSSMITLGIQIAH